MGALNWQQRGSPICHQSRDRKYRGFERSCPESASSSLHSRHYAHQSDAIKPVPGLAMKMHDCENVDLLFLNPIHEAPRKPMQANKANIVHNLSVQFRSLTDPEPRRTEFCNELLSSRGGTLREGLTKRRSPPRAWMCTIGGIVSGSKYHSTASRNSLCASSCRRIDLTGFASSLLPPLHPAKLSWRCLDAFLRPGVLSL